MTRDELVEHCKRQIAQCERWASVSGEETPSGKVYDEHRFILTLLTQPREYEISLADAINLVEQGQLQVHEQAERVVKSELFINKPCVSEQACHEDKMKVLDKVRSDVINIADGRPSIPVRSVIKIIEKHKAESEKTNENQR